MNQTDRAHESLTAEWNALQTAWRDSRTTWDDTVARQFERQFFLSFENDIPQFLSALEALRHELHVSRGKLD